jgi:hypothetical protein
MAAYRSFRSKTRLSGLPNNPAIANDHRNTLKRNLYSNWPERLGDVILL